MKIGLVFTDYKWPGDTKAIKTNVEKIAIGAETNGFDSLWVVDHYFSMSDSSEPMLEAYTVLGFMAGVTKKITLGPLVTGVIYREPAFLVKAATTLDVMSGGRTYFGIGAAWYEQEAKGLGFTFPSTKERFERLEEALQIIKQMWSGNTKPFKGIYYKLEEPINSPQPLSKPHPPIMIGGGGEKKTLKFVAKYADACNLFYAPNLSHKLEVLKKHCQDIGRDYDEIEKTIMLSATVASSGDASAIVKICNEVATLGIEHIIFSVSNIADKKPLEIFGKEIIPSAKEF
ncbi:LLM class F420-dependent oxidoreductase [Patescibacteria group bacterium]|nr:LLM class F420-dependent oxidoreductase [Patescibacteria group bacterium]